MSVCACVGDPLLKQTCSLIDNSHTHHTQETSSFAKPQRKCEGMGGLLACQVLSRSNSGCGPPCLWCSFAGGESTKPLFSTYCASGVTHSIS